MQARLITANACSLSALWQQAESVERLHMPKQNKAVEKTMFVEHYVGSPRCLGYLLAPL